MDAPYTDRHTSRQRQGVPIAHPKIIESAWVQLQTETATNAAIILYTFFQEKYSPQRRRARRGWTFMFAVERTANIKGNRHDKQMNWLFVQNYSSMKNTHSSPSAAIAKRAVNLCRNTYELLSN
jgi:hypothetical protein